MIKRILAILFVILTSCQDKFPIEEYDEYMSVYSEIKKQKIIFKSDLITINNKNVNFDDDNYKLIFIGSFNCLPCVLQMKQLQDLLNDNPKMFNNITTMYIGAGEKDDYIDFQIKKNNFTFPIIGDKNHSFINENNLTNYVKSAILLNNNNNNNNEVLLVGSPFENEKVIPLYNYFLNNYEKH